MCSDVQKLSYLHSQTPPGQYMRDCSVRSVCFIFLLFAVSFVLQERTKMLPREEDLVIITSLLSVIYM